MKKKITFTAAAVLITAACFAQFNKGDRLLGGSFSAGTSQFESDIGRHRSGNVNIAPYYAWFIKNNLAFGIRGGIGYSYNRGPVYAGNRNKTKSLYVSPGLFLTQFKTIKEKFGISFTHDLAAIYNYSKTSSGGIENKNELYGGGYQFTPGVFYRVSENFLTTASLGGLYASWLSGNGYESLSAGVNFLQSFQLGMAYRFAHKK